MSVRRSRGRDLLRNINETEVLKWFIPPTLFAESSLPEVKVRAGARSRHEDIEYAIKAYAPGRVTFRLLPDEGSLIPIIVPRDKEGMWELGRYLRYEEQFIDPWKVRAIRDEMPEEFRYLLTNIFGSHRFKVAIPLEIRMLPYVQSGRVDWIIYGKKLHMTRLRRPSRRPSQFFVDKTSESFPLVLNAFFLPPSGAGIAEEINKYLPYIGPSPFIQLQRSGTGEVARLVYGVLAQVNARVIRTVEAVNMEEMERHRRISLIGVGMPSTANQLVVYGYFVKDTNVFSLSIPPLGTFIEHLLDKLSKLMTHDTKLQNLHLAERYTLLMFNDIFYNSVLYALLNNLTLVAGMQYASLASVLSTYLVFGEVVLGERLIVPCKLDELASNIQEKLLALFERVMDVDLGRGVYKFALKVLKRIRGCRGRLDEERIKRFRYILNERILFLKSLKEEKLTFLAKLLSFILLHTVYHAFIKNVLSRVGGVDDRLLQEGSLDSPWRFPSRSLGEMFIYELSDGGIGAIEAAIQYYAEDPRRFVDDMIRAIGHCVVGVPEELLYYAYLKKGSVKRLSELDIKSVIDELGILVLREEYEEALRLLESLKSEHGGAGLEYLCDALEARKQFENYFLRTPTPDELTLYILKHINAYPRIKQYLVDALRALVNRPVYSRYRNEIEDYIMFKRINEDKWADALLEDIAGLFNGSNEILRFISMAADRRGYRRRTEFVERLIEAAYNTLLATFSRYFLLTCVSACGWCYLNAKSCEETSAPWLQALTLNRRLANLYMTWALSEALTRNLNTRVRIEKGRSGDVVVRVRGNDVAITVVR